MAARTTLLGIEFSFRKAVPTEVNYLVEANFPLPRGHLLVANVPMFAAMRFATCVSPVCPKFGQFFSFSSDAWLFMITISHFRASKYFTIFRDFFRASNVSKVPMKYSIADLSNSLKRVSIFCSYDSPENIQMLLTKFKLYLPCQLPSVPNTNKLHCSKLSVFQCISSYCNPYIYVYVCVCKLYFLIMYCYDVKLLCITHCGNPQQ